MFLISFEIEYCSSNLQHMQNIKDFVSAITEKKFVQATLSKPRPFSPYKNIFIRPVEIGGKREYQATYRTDSQDQVENFSLSELKIQLQMWLITNFYFADLKTKKEDIRLMQSKKGQLTITRGKADNKPKDTSHDRKKKRLIAENAPFLVALGLSSKNGKVHSHGQRKYKQVNRYVELMKNLIKEDKVNHIIDMGSGKGYLTFALYDYLKKHNSGITIKGIELREDLVNKCNEIAKEVSYKGLTFTKGSIESTRIGNSDMVIALHACDIATDMAIYAGIEGKAKYIAVSPCCHKQIRKEMKRTDSVINTIIQHGIFKERQAEMITDTIRALLLESVGYETSIFEFIETEHTPKNVMITAKYTGKVNQNSLKQIEDLKKEFGIESHYLETLLQV